MVTNCKWHALFRIQEQFPLLRKDKDQLPYFLQANLYIEESIKKYGHKNLYTIFRQMMYFYIHDTLIIQMLEEIDPEFRYQSEDKQYTAKVELFKRYRLTKLWSNTVGVWLKKICF